MNQSNKIIFRRGDYKTQEEFYEVLFNQIKILIESGNTFSFHENPNYKGVYALQFNPSTFRIDEDITCPVWLTGEEILYVSAFARKNEYEEAKQIVDEFEFDDTFGNNNKNGDGNPDA